MFSTNLMKIMSRYLAAVYCVICFVNIAAGRHLSESSSEIITEEKGNQLEQSSNFTDLEENTFYNYIEKGYHFVTFFVHWCAHSERLEPTWKELSDSSEFEGKLQFSRVDCEANSVLCDNYGVAAYPTIIWIENGKQIKTYKGKRNYKSLSSFIHKMLDRQEVSN